MKRIYIDTETTGLDLKLNGIIQLAAVMEINGEIINELNLRIRPFKTDIIEDSALAVNSVSREEMQKYTPAPDAQMEFVKFLQSNVKKYDVKDKYSFVAYRADFDFEFVKAWFEKCGDKYFGSWFFNPPICLMQKAAYALESERHLLPNFKLSTVSEFLQIDISDLDFHEAMSDVKAMMRVEEKLKHR